MTIKLRIILLIIVALLIAALISRNAVLVWMTPPFLLYILVGLMSIPKNVHLSAHREISHRRCEAGAMITMTLFVENNGQDIPALRIQESFDSKIDEINQYHEKNGFLPSLGSAKIQYSFSAPRGKYTWENVRVVVSDPFFLFEHTIDLSAGADLVVLPDEVIENQLKLDPDHTLLSPGLYRSNQPGSGISFFGVREYFPGDPLRVIHWRLFARNPQQLFSKQSEREEIADVGLIVDGCAASNLKSGQEQFFETSVRIAAEIARSVLREGNRFSMLILGDRLLRVFPGAGKQQLKRVLDQLAACQPGENVTLSTIKYLPVKLFPSHALIIVISPLSESDIPAITRLLACGYQIYVISPDPVKFVRKSSCYPLAVRAATVERAALLWKIRKMGVNVFDWAPDNNGEADGKSSKESTTKLKYSGQELVDRRWFSPVVTILLVCSAIIGVFSGLPAEMMIVGATLALVAWGEKRANWSRRSDINFAPLEKPIWEQIKPLALSVGVGLLLSIAGLQVHLDIPFGIVSIVIMLLIFCLNRFYVIMTN